MRKLLTVCLCGFCPGRLVQFVFDGGFAAEAGVRAAARGVAMLRCWPLPRCRVCGAAACRAFPSLGARRRAPNPRTRGWWRSLFGSLSDEAMVGFWGACGMILGGFIRHVRPQSSPH